MNKIIRIFIAVVATITLQLNIPTLLDKGEIHIVAASALTITPPDTVVDDDWTGLPIGTTVFFQPTRMVT